MHNIGSNKIGHLVMRTGGWGVCVVCGVCVPFPQVAELVTRLVAFHGPSQFLPLAQAP